MSETSLIERRRPAPDPAPSETNGGNGQSRLDSAGAKIALVVLVCLVATLLVGPSLRFSAKTFDAGDIADADVRATLDFLVPDKEATLEKRREARVAVPTVYDLSPNALAAALDALRASLSRDKTEEPGTPQTNPDSPGKDTSAWMASNLSERWSITITEKLAAQLATPEQLGHLENLVAQSLEPLFLRGVVANRDLLIREGQRGVVIRDTKSGEERLLESGHEPLDFDSARRELAGSRRRTISSMATLARHLSAALIRPNLVHNAQETEARREQAAEAVNTVLYQLRKGEMLVREGDRVNPDQAKKLAAHAMEVGSTGAAWAEHTVLFLSLFMITIVCLEFGRANITKVRTGNKDLAFLSMLFLLLLAFERLGISTADRLGGEAASLLIFAMPMAAGLIVARMVLNSETALMFALPYVAAASIGAGPESGYYLALTFGSLIGAHMAAHASRRVDFLRIGLWTGAGQSFAALLIIFHQGTAAQPEAWWIVAGALAGGATSGLAALGLVPLAESLFGYTTDMRLHELASLDHPLLRDLMLRSPGTYHHSMVTGTLVKSAGEAIGARAALATVAAYYHDIGKCSKPAYFIENQETGKNPHDKLSPSMSTLVLTAHVKEGAELAEKYKLGREIEDIIRQHHGTALISYFHQKACEAARPGVEEVRKEDYRYPGPKPQTREAALVMLADAVEAAARTLPDPKPARIQGMVQNLINRIFADGQLDECDLALQDLHKIARSFTRILSGIHHQRIDYPLAAQKENREDGDLDSKRQSEGRPGRSEASEQNPENLKRLGM